MATFARYADGARVQLERDVRFASADSSRLAVDDTGEVRGLRAGHAQLLVTWGGMTATLEVEVTRRSSWASRRRWRTCAWRPGSARCWC
ncbi:MAG: hypothetical protein AB1730_08070 [Myxococcota bacterium]